MLTVALITIVSLLLLYSVTPQTIENATDEYIKSVLGNVHIDFKYINTILLFVLLWVWMQYCQIVLTIESLYIYIHNIESQISANSKDGFEISRESKSYLSSYPWLKDAAHILYKTLFPVIVISTSIVKLVQECHNTIYYNLIPDIILIGITCIFSLLYVSNRCFHEDAFSPQNKNKKIGERFLEYLGMRG